MTDLSTLSKISFIAAGVFFAVAVFLFFKFRILDVIADLSGKNAKQSIARMRNGAERSGRPRHDKKTQRETTSRLNKTKQYPREPAATKRFGKKTEAEAVPETGLLEDPAKDSEATALLNGGEEATALLNGAEEATALLNGGEDATALLNETDAANEGPTTESLTPAPKRTGGVTLTMLDEVMLIHSDVVL